MRRARIHCAARAMGPAMLQRTISSVMKHYEEYLDQDSQKSLAPDTKTLRADVADVVHYYEPARNFILAVQRQRKNLHGSLAETDRRTLSVVFCHGLDYFRRRRLRTSPNPEVIATTLPSRS